MKTPTKKQPAEKAKFSYADVTTECERFTKTLHRAQAIMKEHGNIDKMSPEALKVVEAKKDGKVGLTKAAYDHVTGLIEKITPYAEKSKAAAGALEAAKETVATARACMGIEVSKGKGKDRD